MPRKAKPDTITFAAVLWVDACFQYKCDDDTVLLPSPVITFGFILNNTPDFITVVSEIHGDGATLQRTVIPKGGVGMKPRILAKCTFLTPPSIKRYRRELGLE